MFLEKNACANPASSLFTPVNNNAMSTHANNATTNTATLGFGKVASGYGVRDFRAFPIKLWPIGMNDGKEGT
jgi:hypothetical protein